MKNLKPFKWFCMQNFPFIEADYDAVTEWQLLQQIGMQCKELTGAVLQIQEYLQNLDLQDEVNNKLDEMAESGELEEIISAYLQSSALICFDTVADLKQAENLIAGSYAKTLGYYNLNDGGGAVYKIVDSIVETANDMTIIAIANDLYAILIYDKSNINVKQMGAHGDGETDDISIVDDIIDLVEAGSKIYFPSGNYILSAPLNITKTLEIEGTSLTNSTGTTFTFNATSGLVMKSPYISVKNINIMGTNRNDNIIDLSNNIYGIIGIINEYTDSYTNGGCKFENCNIHGFNTGIAIFSTRVSESKWSGAYRTFKNCYVNHNQIGYLIKDGATFNSIIGGTISSNTKHGIYAETNTYYQNVEVIDCSLEVNGKTDAFDNNLFTDFGIYCGKETKIKFTNSYLENLKCYVNDRGIIELISTHVHNNVAMFGFGQILSESSHAPYKSEFKYSLDLADRSTNSNLTVTQLDEPAPSVKLECNSETQPRFNLPNLLSIPLPMRDIDWLQFDCDIKIDGGLEAPTLAIRPEFELVGLVENNKDGGNITSAYAPKNCKVSDDKWQHFTFLWKPRIGVEGYISNIDDTVYRLSIYLFLCDTLSYTTPVDFSVNNLDMKFSNPLVTVYGKTKTGYDGDLNYLKTLIPSEE